MSEIADLQSALKMFQQGVNEFAVTKAFSDANQQVREIKNSALKDTEKQQAIYQLSDQLAGNMASQGLDIEKIKQMSMALGAPQFKTPGEAALYGTTRKDDLVLEAAKQADVAAATGDIEKLKVQQKFTAGENEKDRQNKLEVAAMGAQRIRPAPSQVLEKMSAIDDTIIYYKEILDKVKKDPSLVGVVAGRIPGRDTFSPEFATFKSTVGQSFDKYRVFVTGAGASPGELKMLKLNTPQVTDPVGVFTSKLNKVIELSEKIKNRRLSSLKKAGYSVGEDAVDVGTDQSSWQFAVKTGAK